MIACTKLLSLELLRCSEVQTESIMLLCEQGILSSILTYKAAQSLKKLNIHYCTEISDASLQNFYKKLQEKGEEKLQLVVSLSWGRNLSVYLDLNNVLGLNGKSYNNNEYNNQYANGNP